MKKIFKYDWDAIAGIVAAVAAIMMHFLHIIEADILLMIAVVLIALLFLRDLRRESQSEHLDACLHRTELSLKEIASQMRPQDADSHRPTEHTQGHGGFFKAGAWGDDVVPCLSPDVPAPVSL